MSALVSLKSTLFLTIFLYAVLSFCSAHAKQMTTVKNQNGKKRQQTTTKGLLESSESMTTLLIEKTIARTPSRPSSKTTGTPNNRSVAPRSSRRSMSITTAPSLFTSSMFEIKQRTTKPIFSSFPNTSTVLPQQKLSSRSNNSPKSSSSTKFPLPSSTTSLKILESSTAAAVNSVFSGLETASSQLVSSHVTDTTVAMYGMSTTGKGDEEMSTTGKGDEVMSTTGKGDENSTATPPLTTNQANDYQETTVIETETTSVDPNEMVSQSTMSDSQPFDFSSLEPTTNVDHVFSKNTTADSLNWSTSDFSTHTYADQDVISLTMSLAITTWTPEDKNPSSKRDDESNPATVLYAVLSVLCVLAIIAVVLFYMIYRHPEYLRLGRLFEQDEHQMVSLPTTCSKPIKVEELMDCVAKFSMDSGLLFSDEYEKFKMVGRDQTTEQAQLECNRSKNRFTNILPYDHSRVKLIPADDVDGSDYINANWIAGYNSKREYIATQGPLPSTKDDFWRTVWEYNCRTIVMLTLCVENQRIKCEQYWPMNSEPLFYGDLQISIIGESRSTSWIIRNLQIRVGEQKREIRHFHYVEWPDMKVPDIKTMLAFVQMVRSHVNRVTGGPVVVHCSAGVGRTGTFIALDILLQQLQFQHVVDVYGVVYNMRMNRLLMVQTEQQYVFIYSCLKYALSQNDWQSVEWNEEDDEITDTESVLQDSSMTEEYE